MKLWIGTSGFQYPEWKGKFYPEKMPPAKMLPFYAEHFTSTEINYTFRRLPSEKTIRAWCGATSANFRFSFKAPQRVTHFARLRECRELLSVFQKTIVTAEEKMGPVLFQLPPNFSVNVEILRAFLADLPSGMQAAFEFRHASWFTDPVFDTLRNANAALCLAQSEDLATPREVTADFGYLRLRREDYTRGQIREWSKWVSGQQSNWQETFVYFKHEERAVGPKFAQQMREDFGEA